MSRSKKDRAQRRLRCTDAFMLRLYNELTSDFAAVYDNLKDDVNLENCRKSSGNTYFLSEYGYFKRRYQLENLFKRYRFETDVYTDEELNDMANAKFVETQQRIAQPKERTFRSYLVIQEARRITAEILGKYDLEEHMSLCKFGKRADVGVGANDAYLDRKVTSTLTGSLEHILWFEQNYRPTDKMLSDLVDKSKSTLKGVKEPVYQVCESLTLVNVPKSFKSYRSIMPNTRLGAFYSFGLGRVIQERLLESGLDIRHLQNVHRELAQKYSVDRSHVTADLSAASDSFEASLVNMLVPRKWYNVLKAGRISTCDVGGAEVHLHSFMTMGVGFTFPLQTLLFYALLKSIQRLSKTKGLISVYGDDLIYPKGMHRFVVQTFNDIGFILNADKTFVHENFRESCGGDYYCGTDVRPFQPQGQHQLLSPKRFALLVYKTYNGLVRRWNPCEITRTLEFLKREIVGQLGMIHQVPPHYPDYSGVQVDSPYWEPPWYEPWLKISHNGNLSIHFRCLKTLSNDRAVECAEAYLWDKLRGVDNDETPYDSMVDKLNPYAYFLREGKKISPTLKKKLFDLYLSDTENVRWRNIDHHGQKHFYRSKSGKRLRRTFPYEAAKMDAGRILDQTMTVPSWTVILPSEIGNNSSLR